MKKTMIIAAAAASAMLLALASCNKEEAIETKEKESPETVSSDAPIFTATITGATKTTVGVSNGKVAWEDDDEITVKDASSNTAVYKIESIDATTGKATFVQKESETALGEGPYTATYGAEPAKSQKYSATAGKLYMTAPEPSDNNFTFSVQCGLMKLNLTESGKEIEKISVTGTPEGDSETTFTLTCSEAQSIESAKDFFISLPQGKYTKIVITDSDEGVCIKKVTSTPLSILTNHIKPVTFQSLNFVPNTFCLSLNEDVEEYEWNPDISEDKWGTQW